MNIINGLKNWYKARQSQRALDIMEAGWDFAAGRLLEGEPPDIVRRHYTDPAAPDFYNTGIENAVGEWEKQHVAKET